MVCAIGEELENVSLADRVAAQRDPLRMSRHLIYSPFLVFSYVLLLLKVTARCALNDFFLMWNVVGQTEAF